MPVSLVTAVPQGAVLLAPQAVTLLPDSHLWLSEGFGFATLLPGTSPLWHAQHVAWLVLPQSGLQGTYDTICPITNV